MYIFINKGLRMSPGKIAAQAGHAAVEAALISNGITVGSRITTEKARLWDAWRQGLHYAKYVMEARDNEHLRDIQTYLQARGFETVLILDEGHTEVPPISPTALGVALVDKDDPHTAATFSTFSLYREPRPFEVVTPTDAQLSALRESFRRHYDDAEDQKGVIRRWFR